MDHLPQNDVPMLVSAINYLLRDELFEDLDRICDYYHEDRVKLEEKIREGGYEYSEKLKKFGICLCRKEFLPLQHS